VSGVELRGNRGKNQRKRRGGERERGKREGRKEAR